MLFYSKEKVFSLSRTAASVPFGDISALFAEFYCYLLVAGLYREGEGVAGIHWVIPNISDPSFSIPRGSYNGGIADLLTKGLKDRYDALYHHRDVSEHERDLLQTLDGIFTDDYAWYGNLKGRDLLAIAYSRNFSEDMRMIARYVAVAFGQTDFPQPYSVPRLYLSVFGNIHLAKPDGSEDSKLTYHNVTLEAPMMRYGLKSSTGDNVTAMWAIFSAMIDSLTGSEDAYRYAPGNYFGDMLASFSFLSSKGQFEESIPAPSFAQSLYMKQLMGLSEGNPVAVSAMFYSQFLYGSTDELKVSRCGLMNIILDLMMKKMGETRLDHLFTSNSFYRKLATTKTIYATTPKRPAILQFALEALDPSMDKTEDQTDDTDNDEDDDALDPSTKDPAMDPQTDTGGYDPSTPPPVMPVVDTDTDKDTIGLISFDKSGEGVNEDLYRAAVVALNKRLRSDDTLPISSETKDILNYWVNGWIYRTAISATKDQIKQLNLQSYLKNFSI